MICKFATDFEYEINDCIKKGKNVLEKTFYKPL